MIARRFVPHAWAVASTVVLAAVAPPTFAASTASESKIVLKGAPFKAFTDEDTRQFIDAARTAADSTDMADETRWANEASGAWGTLAVKRSFKRNGAPCRELRGENNAGGRTDPFRMVLCRIRGEWKLISSGAVRN